MGTIVVKLDSANSNKLKVSAVFAITNPKRENSYEPQIPISVFQKYMYLS